MKKLLLATALASLGFATAAHAGSVTINGLTITQIPAENPGVFDNNPIGSTTGFSRVCDSAYCGQIYFSSAGDGANGAVENTTTGHYARPAGDTTHYLYGVNLPDPTFGLPGAVVLFTSYSPNSFNIYWGSIDAYLTSNGSIRYDNTLTVYGVGGDIESVTGSQLVAALNLLNPVVNGLGDQGNANDNQWFNIRDTYGPLFAFQAQSPNYAFEFDMAVPEPATWAMMALGFAGLGYAGFRRNGKSKVAIA